MGKFNFKRGLALFLSVTLLCGLIQAFTGNTSAVKGDTGNIAKTIAGLGTGIIADPTVPTAATDAWTGSYVYFGAFEGNPVKYRVLDKDSTDFGGTTMLLDCDTILWSGTNSAGQSSVFDADSNIWADSDIKRYLNSEKSSDESTDTYDYSTTGFLTTSFSALEQNAIASSNKASAITGKDGNGYSILVWTELMGEKIFFLDAKEVTNTSYGYYDIDGNVTGRIKKGGNNHWRLRSPNSPDSSYIYVGHVSPDGWMEGTLVRFNLGVSPAFNINLSSVLFSSVISGTAGETGAEYKLTVIDSDMTIAGDGAVTRSGDTVTIPYTIGGTNSANATQVSVLILDRVYSDDTKNEAVVKYYGALDTTVGDGTGTFTLSADLSDKICGKDYYAYIIAEDVNGEKETDYASEPVKISIPWMAQAMNLGVNGIIDPIVPTAITDEWTGCYVYYGVYEGNPVKYRVLDKDSTDFGGTTMLLDCDTILWAETEEYGKSCIFDEDSNVWAESYIKRYLNSEKSSAESTDTYDYSATGFLTTSFSALEQNAIADSSKSGVSSTDGEGLIKTNNTLVVNYTALNGEKIFFLDTKEVTNTSYGYYNTAKAATGRMKIGGYTYWWLRSTYGTYSAASVDTGVLNINDVVGWSIGCSPALNLNLSSILFSSASGTSKSLALTSASNEIGCTAGTEWKLTLLDSGKTVKVTDDEKVIKAANGTITVPYTYTDTATAETEKVNRVSVMITDKAYTEADANILYYGALQNIKASDGNATTVTNATAGTGTFELPGALNGKVMGTDYHIYILAEHTVDSNATDYASAPIELTKIYDAIENTAITITAPESKAALDEEATVDTSVIAAADVVWSKNTAVVSGNADYNTSYTATITLTAEQDYAFTAASAVTINGNDTTVILNSDGTLTATYVFDTTAKRKITSIEAPKTPVDGIFTSYYTAENILSSSELGGTATVTLEGDTSQATSDMDVEWSIVGAYDVTPGASNTYKWTVKATEYADYDSNATVMEGTVSIKNNEIVDPDLGVNTYAWLAPLVAALLGAVVILGRKKITE